TTTLIFLYLANAAFPVNSRFYDSKSSLENGKSSTEWLTAKNIEECDCQPPKPDVSSCSPVSLSSSTMCIESRTMFSSANTTLLCIFAFLFGQIFNDLCVPISSPVEVRIIEKVVIVNTGYSFKVIIASVLSVLVVGNVLMLLACGYPSAAKTARRCSIIILPGIASKINAQVVCESTRFPERVPKPNRARLVLANRYSRPTLCIPVVGDRIDIQGRVPTFNCAFRNLAIPSFRLEGRVLHGALRIKLNIGENEDEDQAQAVALASTHAVEYEDEAKPKFDRNSRASFLQHVAAAALLKLQFSVIEEERCCASVYAHIKPESQLNTNVGSGTWATGTDAANVDAMPRLEEENDDPQGAQKIAKIYSTQKIEVEDEDEKMESAFPVCDDAEDVPHTRNSVYGPPPLLSLLTARLSSKDSECGSNLRVSHMSLIGRLSSQISASVSTMIILGRGPVIKFKRGRGAAEAELRRFYHGPGVSIQHKSLGAFVPAAANDFS
ncbi:hypothetical protein C8F04DRAFT_1368268, partial [Mycena alexandri]